MPHHERQTIALDVDHPAGHQLHQGVLEEGTKTDRVEALLEVAPEVTEAGAVARGQADVVDPASVHVRQGITSDTAPAAARRAVRGLVHAARETSAGEGTGSWG